MGKGPGAGLHQAYWSNPGEEEAGVGAERAREEEKRMTEDEMVGWHHQLDGHEFG